MTIPEAIMPGTTQSVPLDQNLRIDLCWCPPTTGEIWRAISGGNNFFLMGEPQNSKSYDKFWKQHRVVLTKGFWLGRTMVTRKQWDAVMEDAKSHLLDSFFAKKVFGLADENVPDYPVDHVYWDACQRFLASMNARVPLAGLKWALPTEAQWEYACRAGTTGEFGGTGDLWDMGWFKSNSKGRLHRVAEKLPNAWGLYDMHGNLYEWCSDAPALYPDGLVEDPFGGEWGDCRVARGGYYGDFLSACSSSYRIMFPTEFGIRDDPVGIRLAVIPA